MKNCDRVFYPATFLFCVAINLEMVYNTVGFMSIF